MTIVDPNPAPSWHDGQQQQQQLWQQKPPGSCCTREQARGWVVVSWLTGQAVITGRSGMSAANLTPPTPAGLTGKGQGWQQESRVPHKVQLRAVPVKGR